MTEEEREDAEALRWYVPAGSLAALERRARRREQIDNLAFAETANGIEVTVSVNGYAPAPRATSGTNEIARHRPTRYALMMRRRRANAQRKATGQMQRPAILPGSCTACRGLGVINDDRARCPVCHGSGDR